MRVTPRVTSQSIYEDFSIPALRSFLACAGLLMLVPRWGTLSPGATISSIGWAHPHLSKWAHPRLNKWMHPRLSKWAHTCLNKWMHPCLNSWMHTCLNRWAFMSCLIYNPNGAEASVTPVKRRQERRPGVRDPTLSSAEVTRKVTRARCAHE